LIVDDEADLREIVRMMLENNNIEVVSAENGKEALGFAREEKFDVILSDINMPEMTGLEFLEAMSKTENQTLVVFYNGYFEPKLLHKCMALGVFDFLEKPIGTKQLLEVIGHAAEVGVLQRKIAFIHERNNEKLNDLIVEYEHQIARLSVRSYVSVTK
jgi:DNA-binding NtrC family response regulator